MRLITITVVRWRLVLEAIYLLLVVIIVVVVVVFINDHAYAAALSSLQGFVIAALTGRRLRRHTCTSYINFINLD